MKKTNGITLIALVITIIVLLILAGVSISAITGENGIVDKAKEAAEKTEVAEKEEEDALKDIEEWINNSVEESNIIKFTIAGTEYKAEEGMTWLEWIETEYNVDNYVLYAENAKHIVEANKEYWIIKTDNGADPVEKNDVIIENHAYYLDAYGSAGIG